MKVHIIIIIICWSTLLRCPNKTRFSDRKLSFEELPIDVREKFKEVYNYCPPPTFNGTDTIEYMPPFVEAHNLNGDSVVINPHIFVFSNSFTIISSGKQIESSFDIIERVFIIKGDSIYYPISGNGITSYGEPRSNYVDVDTLMFQVSIMK